MVRRTCRTATWIGLLAPVVFALAACSGPSALDAAHAGRTVHYEPGVPNFDMEVVSTYREGHPGLDLYVGIPHVSLVFVQTPEGFVAAYERVVRILDRSSRAVVYESSVRDTLRVDRYEATQSPRAYVRHQRLPAAAGRYVVEVDVTDVESGKRVVRQQAAEVAAADSPEPHLSRMRLVARRDGAGAVPLLSFHVPAGIDSLQAIVELFPIGSDDDVEVTLRLLRFESDTSVARAPYWLAAPHGSLERRGVRFGRADTLQVSRRRLRDAGRETAVVFALPPLASGMYRLVVRAKVTAASREASPLLLEEERSLSVREPGFPGVERLQELVSALAYIAYDNELRYIRSAGSTAEMRRRFDAFWGSLVSSRRLAANLMRHYYSRVEEANLFFTTHKEGWKTDRGMIYVIFGPPFYVEENLDHEVWHYSQLGRDAVNTFTFEQVRPYDVDGGLEHFVLRRRPYYQRPWIRAVDRWRDGDVL